jgi:DNA-binding transcriptional regulator YdaS (Cro superfamily)
MNKRLKARIVLRFGTQEDFAQSIGERSTIVSNVVRGRRRLSPYKELEWAMALGCSPIDIFPKQVEEI